MRSALAAILWEMFQQGRWSVPLGIVGANMFPIFLYSALRMDGAGNLPNEIGLSMHLTLTQFNMFIFCVAVFHAQGNPSRLFTYPLTNASLVAWHLLPGMALIAVEQLASTLALNALFDLNWPLWGPVLFATVSLAAIQAVMWMTVKSAWVTVGMALVAGVMGLWYKSRLGPLTSQPTHHWTEVTPLEMLTLAAVAGLAYRTAVAGMARNRRGEDPLSLGIIAWCARMLDWTPKAEQPFRSAAIAHQWYEWRKAAWMMPVAVAFMLAIGLLLWLTVSRRAEDLVTGCFGAGAILTFLGFIAGLMAGNNGPNNATFDMGQFFTTRPMTSPQMARTILRTMAWSALFGWLVWIIALAAAFGIVVGSGTWNPAGKVDNMVWAGIAANLVGAWTAAGLCASMALSGRDAQFIKLVLWVLTLFVAQTLFSKYALSDDERLVFNSGMTTLLGCCLTLATITAFVAAIRRSLIAWPTLYAAFAAWSVFSVAALTFGLKGEPVATICLVLGLLALPLAPLATAPLALAWNRVR